jgi:hypothetical protein
VEQKPERGFTRVGSGFTHKHYSDTAKVWTILKQLLIC